jgi:hypothetical protein
MKRSSVTSLFAAFLVLPGVLVSQTGTLKTPVTRISGVATLLIALQGKWHFDLYSDGDTLPNASGEREMRLLSDSTKLAWTETPVDRPHRVDQSHAGSGFLGYNAATDAWYVLGAYTHEPNPVVLVGRADRSGRILMFDPLETTSRPGTYVSSELRLVDAEHFEWVASDGAWRTVFTRVGHS